MFRCVILLSRGAARSTSRRVNHSRPAETSKGRSWLQTLACQAFTGRRPQREANYDPNEVGISLTHVGSLTRRVAWSAASSEPAGRGSTTSKSSQLRKQQLQNCRLRGSGQSPAALRGAPDGLSRLPVLPLNIEPLVWKRVYAMANALIPFPSAKTLRAWVPRAADGWQRHRVTNWAEYDAALEPA
jgi:hypothetical protein